MIFYIVFAEKKSHLGVGSSLVSVIIRGGGCPGFVQVIYVIIGEGVIKI